MQDCAGIAWDANQKTCCSLADIQVMQKSDDAA